MAYQFIKVDQRHEDVERVHGQVRFCRLVVAWNAESKRTKFRNRIAWSTNAERMIQPHDEATSEDEAQKMRRIITNRRISPDRRDKRKDCRRKSDLAKHKRDNYDARRAKAVPSECQ